LVFLFPKNFLYNTEVKSKRPQQKTRREKRRFKKRAIIIFSSIVVIFSTFLFIMNHSFLRLDTIKIQGQRTLIETDIIIEVQNYLTQKNLMVFPQSNIFLFNGNILERRLTEQFPKISDIDVSIHNAEEIIITIGERSAHSLWCINQEYESVFDEECYFADQDGILYARAPYFSGNIYLKLFILPQDIEDYIGMNINSQIDFDNLFDFLYELESDYSLRIERIYFDEFDDVRIKLARVGNTLYQNQDVFILYNSLDDYETILRNIRITLGFDKFKDTLRDRPQSLESIDVRFDGRIFYTFTPIENESD